MPPRLSASNYLKAIARCRKRPRFYFLDLPVAVRQYIYQKLFVGNTVTVCSWLKSHEGDFAPTERCQILLTCRTIWQEAEPYLYYYSIWKFRGASPLQYFTWPDVSTTKWANLTNIVLTRTDSLPTFSRHLHKFCKLQRLVLNVAAEFKVYIERRPQPHERCTLVESIFERRLYREHVHQHIYIQRKWEVCICLHVQYGDRTEDVCTIPLQIASTDPS